jgi:ribosomal protein S18 acetylase RimI-like enzyme
MLEFLKMTIGSLFIIRPVQPEDLEQVLEVYRQCEDFLALGPTPRASVEMVLGDLKISQEAGGIFCGIYKDSQDMIGVLDYIPQNFEGNPDWAFIELLMIAAPHRRKGLGKEIVQLVEKEIVQNPRITDILLGVQVNNPGAQEFWRKVGYQIISGPVDCGDGTTAYRLCKHPHPPPIA